MVDFAYVNGMADDCGDPDHDIHDPDGHCGIGPGAMFTQLLVGQRQALPASTWPRRQSVYGPPIECKFCGQSAVYWQKVKGKYRLHDIEGLQPHVCPPKDNTPEGFE